MIARSLRGLVAAAVLVAAVSAAAEAQEGRQVEIRLDFASLQTSDGSTAVSLEFPGTVAVGFYMNQNFALEPRVGLRFISSDLVSGNILEAGVFAPYYFAGDFGKTGVFVAPGVTVSKGSGDLEYDAQTDYGVDLGIKLAMRDRISSRIALTFRDGDSSPDPVIGATFGIGYFFR
jgi:hypothetical protein